MKTLVLIAALLMMVGCAPDTTTTPDGGYILQFGDSLKASSDDFGISIAIVVDVSGSMNDSPQSGGARKYQQAARALQSIYTYLEGMSKPPKSTNIRVAVFKFSNEVVPILPLTTLNADGLVKFQNAIVAKNFTPDGGTAIGSAIETASKTLISSGTTFNSIIVMTDGESNDGPDAFAVEKALFSDSNTAKVKTSSQLLNFVGFDVQSSEFATFKSLGANVMAAGDQAELEKSFKSILDLDFSKMESK